MIRKIFVGIAAILVVLFMMIGIVPASDDTLEILEELDVLNSLIQADSGNRSNDSALEEMQNEQDDKYLDTTDIVTIYEDMTLEVVTEEGCYIKIKQPFGMIAFTQDQAVSQDSYNVQHMINPQIFIEHMKKKNIHIFLTDLVNGTNMTVSVSKDSDEEDNDQEITLGENVFLLSANEEYREYKYISEGWVFRISIKRSGNHLDEFDINNVEKMLSEAEFSVKAKR